MYRRTNIRRITDFSENKTDEKTMQTIFKALEK